MLAEQAEVVWTECMPVLSELLEALSFSIQPISQRLWQKYLTSTNASEIFRASGSSNFQGHFGKNPLV